jgi:hypothetical protein
MLIHSRFAERGAREKNERALRQAKIREASGSKKWVNEDAEIEAEFAPGLPSAFN